MTAEQINVIIAEHCGWVLSFDGEFWSWNHPAISHRVKHTAHKWMASQGVLPNYSGDLNAMHLAELCLKKDDPHAYGCYVTELMDGEADAISKSAAERAEMFVRIIGKWID